MQAAPPYGFIVHNGKFIRVIANYTDLLYDGPILNFPEKAERVAEELCLIGNAIGALPVGSDCFPVIMPDGANERIEIKFRYFMPPTHHYELAGIVPDIVAFFIVERTH